MDEEGARFSCLLLFLVFFVAIPIVAIIFPKSRDAFAPVALMADFFSDLGVTLPVIEIGPLLVYTFLLGFMILTFLLFGVLIAMAFSSIFDLDLNIEIIGAFSSILGLIVGVISLVLQHKQILDYLTRP